MTLTQQETKARKIVSEYYKEAIDTEKRLRNATKDPAKKDKHRKKYFCLLRQKKNLKEWLEVA